MKIHLRPLWRMYAWTLLWAGHRRAPLALFIISFVESSFFLVPPDILLIPMVIAKPNRWFWLAALTTGGSVLGGIFGYYIGVGLWESLGKIIVEIYHLESFVEIVRGQFASHAFLTVFSAAFTPIPYKVITIASGLFHVSFFTFLSASVMGRGLRFFLVAGLVGVWGEGVKQWIDDYFDILSIAFLVILIGGFLVIKLLL